nr:hypothetical protein [uncultured Allomuricauda sp.]
MKYLVKISLILMLFYPPFFLSEQLEKEKDNNSMLDCIQGVWQPINSENKGLIEYTIYDSFNSVSISYTPEKELESMIFTTNGFYDFENGYNLSDSLRVSDLKKNGRCFVWFFSEDVSVDEWAQLGGVQEDFICDDGIIEMSDNAMTILKKKKYLPYAAYNFLKERGKKDNRDYTNKFHILGKLKKAEVMIDKAYFYDSRNEDTKRKAFLIKGDSVIIDQINENWVRAAYEGKKITTLGWLRQSDIEIKDE